MTEDSRAVLSAEAAFQGVTEGMEEELVAVEAEAGVEALLAVVVAEAEEEAVVARERWTQSKHSRVGRPL